MNAASVIILLALLCLIGAAGRLDHLEQQDRALISQLVENQKETATLLRLQGGARR